MQNNKSLRKKILIPLIAVIVLAILLVIVLFTGGSKEENTVNSDSAGTVENLPDSPEEFYIFDLDSYSISHIKVKCSGETFAFKKQDDTWVYDGNTEISLSSTAISSLATSIVGITYIESIDDGSVTMEDCGITSESDYITFISNGDEITVYKGIATPDGMQTYVMTSQSDVVYLANSEKINNIFKPMVEYRHSASLSIDFDNLTEITVKSEETISLKKVEADAGKLVFNQWSMVKPVEVGARDDQVTPLIIDPLKKIAINDFVSDSGDFANYGLGNKDRYVTLKDASGRVQTLYFSEKMDGQYYICVNDSKSIYSISYGAAPYVELKTGEIFDRNIHLVKMSDISTVTLKGSGYDYEIEFFKDGGKINGTDVSADVMNQKVFPAVCGIFADDILSEASGETQVTLTFNYTDSKKDVITFADHSERYYSVSKNGSVKYLILKAKISEMATILDECK